MKAHVPLGKMWGLEKKCRTIIYLKGMEYRGTLICDETVRMHIPRNIVSYLLMAQRMVMLTYGFYLEGRMDM
jgi:hypothetical protein